MLIRFLRCENSERVDSWSCGSESNFQVPRIGDEIEKEMTASSDDKEGNTYIASFKVKKVIWVSPSIVTVMIQERTN